MAEKQDMMETSSNSSGSKETTTILKDVMFKFLQQFYNEGDAQKITDEFMKEFYKSMSNLTLDDIERIATSYLQEAESS